MKIDLCRGYDARSKRPCIRIDTVEVVVACLHEHMSPRNLCPWHIDDLKAGRMLCGNCLEAGCDCRLQQVKEAVR